MVNTFITSEDYQVCVTNLDKRRRFKQTVEAKQIIQIIEKLANGDNKIAFKHHPIVKIWRNHLESLKEYYNTFLKYITEVDKINTTKLTFYQTSPSNKPWFMLFKPLLYSHQARLIQKDPMFYKDKFSVPSVYFSIGYIWLRNDQQFYQSLTVTDEDEIRKIADPLGNKYINPIYCQAVLKTGIRKGTKCGNILSKNVTYCGIHNR